jgi:hypothetical protein
MAVISMSVTLLQARVKKLFSAALELNVRRCNRVTEAIE